MKSPPSLAMHKQKFSVLAAVLSSASLQEEKQGLQKDAPSDGSSTKSILHQDEWETSPINMFWTKKKKGMRVCLNVWKHIRISRKPSILQAFQICIIMKKDIFQSDFYFSVPSDMVLHTWLKIFLKNKKLFRIIQFYSIPWTLYLYFPSWVKEWVTKSPG